MRPLSFREFLISLGEANPADVLKTEDWGVISIFSGKLNDYLRYYLYIGGMPEVVEALIKTRDWQLVRRIQKLGAMPERLSKATGFSRSSKVR